MPTTVIIGGVAGGMSAATRLRRNDESRQIIVLEASGNVSFANCGLPYHISGTITERSDLLLQTPQSLKARFNLDVRVNTEAVAIDAARKIVHTADGEEIDYDELILSPGAYAVNPYSDALTLRNVEDMDAIIAAAEGASSARIVGGGFIGLELAENLARRGLAVTIVERAAQILTPLDPEMAEIVAEHLEEHGITILTNASLEHAPAADLTIAAIGVRPSVSLAQSAGLAIGELGGIVVDDQMRTSDPSIFAVGDAVEKRDAISGAPILVALAQSANRQGRLVADVIAGKPAHDVPVLGTAIVGVFGLSAASVGWNERRARRERADAVRVIHLHPANHAGYYPGASTLHIKLVIDANSDEILGAQIVGAEGVDKRIDVLATAMRAGLKAPELATLELAYAPQFGSAKDPINFAGYIASNREATVQWHEVAELVGGSTGNFTRGADYLAGGADGNANAANKSAAGDAAEGGTVLVDVRTPAEYARGQIPGAINVPLDTLRENYQQFEGKSVIVHCQVGMRGHIAVTLLENLGIPAANLDGGYVTWKYGQAAQERGVQ
ncbi:MAG: FAD-dependent oxidoreductase [Actinomycetaceae bacterium]|nr:FAD-dependent oxidoreductase [Actinomycetaceae bacterium]MDY5854376.1 FAD-dependent oxidoreductase [Arcanobacterium sp.]